MFNFSLTPACTHTPLALLSCCLEPSWANPVTFEITSHCEDDLIFR